MSSLYSLADHPNLQGPLRVLFDELKKRIMDLDHTVSMKVFKGYIAFSYNNHFVDVLTRKRSLRVLLSIPINILDDPEHLCNDLQGAWDTFEAEFVLASPDQLDYCMHLIEQAYVRDRQRR